MARTLSHRGLLLRDRYFAAIGEWPALAQTVHNPGVTYLTRQVPMRHRCAFTLIELLVVISIIALLIAMLLVVTR